MANSFVYHHIWCRYSKRPLIKDDTLGPVNWKSVLLHAYNKGSDQTAHLRSLISAIVICSLESKIPQLASCTITREHMPELT